MPWCCRSTRSRQIQALDRTQPGLPIKPGKCGTMTHDYKRNGTTTLFAALNILDGTVHRPLHAEAHPSGVHPLPQRRRARRPGRQDRPRHPRQLRHPQAPQGAAPGWPPPALGVPLHPDLGLLAQRRRELLLGAHPARLRRGVFSSIVDLQEAINRYIPSTTRSQTLRLDQDRRPDHRQAEHSECVSALCLPFAAWNLDHLVAHLAGRASACAPRRIRDFSPGKTSGGGTRKPGSASGSTRSSPVEGAIERLGTAAPAGSVVVCLDETGPQAVKSYPGRRLVQPAGRSRGQTRQAEDRPRSAWRRTAANRVDFLGRVGASVDPLVERIYAVLDNPSVHSAPDVPQFALPHPRREFAFPAQVRHLPGPDRALVEAAALPGPERVPLRRLGRDRASDRTGHRLLERPQARLRLGSTAPSAPVPPPAHSRRAETHSNLADAPLMLPCQTLGPVSVECVKFCKRAATLGPAGWVKRPRGAGASPAP